MNFKALLPLTAWVGEVQCSFRQIAVVDRDRLKGGTDLGHQVITHAGFAVILKPFAGCIAAVGRISKTLQCVAIHIEGTAQRSAGSRQSCTHI